MSELPRGIRNNNPFNVKMTATVWLGEVDRNTDGVFEQIDTPEHGLRIGMKLLKNYHIKHGINTIAKLVNRFAPSMENDVDAYCTALEQAVGYKRDEEFNFCKPSNMIDLSKGIVRHENGDPAKWGKQFWYSEMQFIRACAEALGTPVGV